MFNEFKLLKNENIYTFSLIILVSILPLIILSGSALINASTLIVSLIFLIISLKDKKIKILKNYYFYLLLFFFISLLINIFFSRYGFVDYSRQLGFIRFIIFIFAISYCLNFSNNKYKEFIFKIWFLVFLIVSFDLCFEYIFNFNIIGNTSYMPGRLSSFLGDELKIGNYYYGFFLISLTYLLNLNFKNNFFLILIMILLIIIAYIIGERSNFIRIFICFIIFLYICENFSLTLKLISSLTILLTIFFITYFNENINSRMKQIYEPILEFGVIKYVKTSHYGAHYDTALKIFDANKFFGIGLKQFRNESNKTEYDENKNNIYQRDNWATHPHQVHFEVLSESGLFGYISFLIFFVLSLIKSIKSYLETRNKYLLSGIIFIIISLIPLLPSGSFFTTYSATIFWINYALIVSFDNREYK